ncbi:DUF1631 domain-containing protein [Pseudomonas sp. NPDC089569]|uniref:DUF1631 domain-containing protein n=1 Tax=Pseudomonas sp. NPDC089569 TaxID=3390722 RepID=UPI003D0395D2
MHNGAKVVSLRKATTDQANLTPLTRLPAILLQVRDRASQQLRQGLQTLFDNADDSLFEMLDRAGNGIEQPLVFQAMRDLRLKKKTIERIFFEQFFEAFIGLTHYRATHTLLTDGNMERKTSVEVVINKVLNRDGFALDQLTARLGTLLGRSLMEQHNPMGPTMLCGFFLQAGRSLGVETRVKLILLQLFERYVLSETGSLYAEANQLLLATGVLPDLNPAPARQNGEGAAVDAAKPPLDDAQSREIAVADEDVISLIARLFECTLGDRNLPDNLIALIDRLQVPIVKVAVLDKRFFSHSRHPARRLLNEIAQAAMQWSECDEHERKLLYLRIEQVVQRLLSDDVGDPGIFTDLLAEFLAFTRDERRRSEMLEQRTRDAEEGRVKAAMSLHRVEQAMNQVLLGKRIPQSVLLFVRDAWSKVLLMTCLKHGDQSMQWHAALQTLEQLVWSVQRHDERDTHSRLLALLPDLLKSLREGLGTLAFEPPTSSGFFSELQSLHVQLLEPLRQPGPLLVEVVDDVVLAGAEASPVQRVSLPLPADDAGLRQVDQLLPGCRVEFQEDPDTLVRCKLAAIIQATDHYIFVNRTGLKVLEYSRASLALEFRRGTARVLDDTLLFDRALASVLGQLQHLNCGK